MKNKFTAQRVLDSGKPFFFCITCGREKRIAAINTSPERLNKRPMCMSCCETASANRRKSL